MLGLPVATRQNPTPSTVSRAWCLVSHARHAFCVAKNRGFVGTSEAAALRPATAFTRAFGFCVRFAATRSSIAGTRTAL